MATSYAALQTTLSRRDFCGATALLLAGCHKLPGQQPLLLSAGRANGKPIALAVTAEGKIRWQQPLPRRGHDIALHPEQPLAAFVGRRPGVEIWLLDTRTGKPQNTLKTPKNVQFNGHAVFSNNGGLLYCTETRFDRSGSKPQGQIGIYSVLSGKRFGEFSSGGVDPHQCRLSSDGSTLVVANGGKLEIAGADNKAAAMSAAQPSSLCWIDAFSGRLKQCHSLPLAQHAMSLRHIALSGGDVIVGLQRQAHEDPEGLLLNAPLVYTVSPNTGFTAMPAPINGWGSMNGYIGSVATNKELLLASSPKSGLLQQWKTASRQPEQHWQARDLSGITTLGNRVIATTGTGRLLGLGSHQLENIEFDNHCILAG